MRYVLTRRAERDLDEIWDYTSDRWDNDQAELYTKQIRNAVEGIAADPERGRPASEIRGGYRKFVVGSHMIFFRALGDRVEIVRILHQRMDFARHLRAR
jgi:toxin ParE1/3/4